MTTFTVAKDVTWSYLALNAVPDHRKDYVYLAHCLTTLSKPALPSRRNSPYACAGALTTSEDYIYRGLLTKGPDKCSLLGEFCGQAVVAPRDM